MSGALVLGEALIDIVLAEDGSRSEHAGGSPMNTAVAMARLGHDAGRPVALATCFGRDARGAVLADHLARSNVALAGDPYTVASTSTALATLQADGSAEYVFELDWRLAAESAAPSYALVHTGSLATVLAPGCEQVLATMEAQRARVAVTYDLNARPAAAPLTDAVQGRIRRACAAADLVKASDEDLAAVFPELSLAEAAEAVLACGPAAVVVTEGAAGAWCRTTNRMVRVAAEPVSVADTIGAGDSFCAALLDGLWALGCFAPDQRPDLAGLSDDQWHGLLSRAARAAAITVSRAGANPPTATELDGG